MNFYEELKNALISDNISKKELIVNKLINYCLKNDYFDNDFLPVDIKKPSYESFCKIVNNSNLPKRNDLSSNKGFIALLHAIAHIEYSAIDLALDAVYYFANMPKEYKLDWLIVAQDEIRHFLMIEKLLKKLKANYGDLPVHKNLFEMARQTRVSALDRMAIIPRFFEATGLDVNPKIMQKVKNSKHPLADELIKSLNIILEEEISHVTKGDKWFKYLCDLQNYDYMQKYIEIINKYNLKSRPQTLNINARKKAGFSCDELIKLGAKKCD
jgi:uncharacterized ferritin-like protein (DUF455 family)